MSKEPKLLKKITKRKNKMEIILPKKKEVLVPHVFNQQTANEMISKLKNIFDHPDTEELDTLKKRYIATKSMCQVAITAYHIGEKQPE
jgi:uncharacterized protein with ParB-like and HNH nuclease domain